MWYNGSIPASQAGDAGSIPVIRSRSIADRMRGQRTGMRSVFFCVLPPARQDAEKAAQPADKVRTGRRLLIDNIWKIRYDRNTSKRE
jgi:hypothetical protein